MSDLNKILDDLHVQGLHHRHERLLTLLTKLRDNLLKISTSSNTSSKPGGAQQVTERGDTQSTDTTELDRIEVNKETLNKVGHSGLQTMPRDTHSALRISVVRL